MRRLSSSATLGLKVFIPTLWIVFFGTLSLAILISGPDKSPLFRNWMFKGGVILFFTLGLLVLYYSLIQLQRVELDHKHLYVSNYIKTYRYTFDSIEKLSVQDLYLFRLGIFTLKTRGALGRRIFFLQSRQKFDDFVNASPELVSRWMTPENIDSLA